MFNRQAVAQELTDITCLLVGGRKVQVLHDNQILHGEVHKSKSSDGPYDVRVKLERPYKGKKELVVHERNVKKALERKAFFRERNMDVARDGIVDARMWIAENSDLAEFGTPGSQRALQRAEKALAQALGQLTIAWDQRHINLPK